MPSPVRTLMVYRAGATATLFAASAGAIRDVTAGGDVISTAVTSLNGNDWISTNFATSGGNYLVLANGADAVRNFDGATWTSPTITGVTSASLNYVTQYKATLWFLRNNSSHAYALPVDSISGTVTDLNVGAELTKGGTLVAAAAVTQDAGLGPDDVLAFISSEGEVVLYQGTDPGDATLWSKVGTYQIGRPIGRRCVYRVGGDVAVLTQDGVVSLSQAIQLDRSQEQNAAFTSNIRKAFADQYLLTGSVFGWQILVWPAAHMALVNVPVVDGVTYYQYVMNTITGAWCRYKGVDAVCWAVDGDDVYFGTADGRVMLFGEVSRDDGSAIDAVCVGAFTPMKRPGYVKHTKMAQVFARGSGAFNLGVNIAVDFTPESLAVEEHDFATSVSGSLWDSATWDSATWGGGGQIAEETWLGVAVSGHFLAPVVLGQVNSASKVDAEFISKNILYEVGSIVG